MAKRKTHEEFVEEVYNLVGDEYIILEKYKNTQTKVEVKHIKCKHEWLVIPRNFLKGTRCPKCFGNAKKSHNDFLMEVFNLVGNEYKVLNNYKNTKTHIKFKHIKCEHEFKMTPDRFLYQGSRCPKCFGTFKKDTEEFQRVVNNISNGYLILGTYVDSRTKIKLKHEVCCYEWDVRPNDFLNGSRCPKCQKRLRKTTDYFKEEVKELVEDEFEVLGEYINAHSLISFKHNKCENIFDMSPSSFLNGQRCPICRLSKAESIISNILNDYYIDNTQQFKFDDCRNVRSLPFDFAIFDNMKSLKFLLEYDGEQHYKPWRMTNKDEALRKFNEIKRNDKIKTDYCIKNKIPLLRIPYWDFLNIEEIVLNELKKLNLVS